MKILILGHKGMLGHMVLKYFQRTAYDCQTINYRWPSEQFQEVIQQFEGDYIINCIGKIPQKTDRFAANYLIPAWLDLNANCRIIYPGTDCEIDNTRYGISKRKASYWIKEKGTKTKIITTSVIGPELNTKYGLFEWFLDQKEVNGYSEFYWNGNTTLEWAKCCLGLMECWEAFETETVLQSECISKYDLLNEIKAGFNKDTVINKVNVPEKNKCLVNGIKTDCIEDQLKELKEFYYN